MTNIVRRDPIVESVMTPISRLSRLFDEFLNDFWGDATWLTHTGTDRMVLPVDVSEDDKNLYIRASLPGFRKEDITVEVQNGIVSIQAQHSQEQEHRGETFVRRERRVGAFARQIALPTPVQEDRCEAELRDGVLTLRLPKSPEALPRRVQIRG